MFSEVVVQRCPVKKVLLESSQNSQEKSCAKVPFLINLQATSLKKETLAQAFFCEFCKISKSTFFHRTFLVAASVFSQNFIFHAQVKKFFISLKNHALASRYVALFLSISYNVKPNLKSVTS